MDRATFLHDKYAKAEATRSWVGMSSVWKEKEQRGCVTTGQRIQRPKRAWANMHLSEVHQCTDESVLEGLLIHGKVGEGTRARNLTT